MEIVSTGRAARKSPLRLGQIAPYFSVLVIALLAALFLLNLFHSAQLLTDWYSPLPLMDYWRVPQDLPALYGKHVSALWQQHNEHRIVFPELVFAADVLLFHGRMILPLAVSCLCYLGVWGTLVWAAYSQRVMTWPFREAALLLAAALMFWEGSLAVLATPFQLAFTLQQFVVALGLASLAMLRETGRNIFVATLIAAAVVATYSAAGGMVVWPIVIAGAILLRVRLRQVAALSASGALAIGLFFVGYRSPGSLRLLPLAHHLDYLFSFVAEYLAMPFDHNLTHTAAVWGWRVGTFSLIVFICCLGQAIRKRLWTTRLGVLVFGTYFYTLASVLLTAAGRMDPADPFFTAPKAPRYVTVSMAAMATLVVAAIWLLSQTRWRRLAMPLALAIAVAASTAWADDAIFVQKAAQVFSQLQISALMLRNNLQDSRVLTTIFPSPTFVQFYLPLLLQKRLSIYARGIDYAHGGDNWLGRNVKTLWPFSQAVPGQITLVYPLEGGLEIYGWTDSPFLTDDHAVLFADQDGNIAGFGKRPRAGFPLGFGTWDTPPSLSFIGFVRLTPAVRSLSAYVWAHPDKTLHRMGQPIAIPAFIPAVNPASAGPLPDINWNNEGAFHVNGQLVSDENGPAPAGTVYGSYGAAKTGDLRSEPLPVPANHCVVLPVLHGLSAYGQSVKLINADNGQDIASAPMFDGQSVWERWRISIPADITRVAVLAKDTGDRDNQWVAVANLSACP